MRATISPPARGLLVALGLASWLAACAESASSGRSEDTITPHDAGPDDSGVPTDDGAAPLPDAVTPQPDAPAPDDAADETVDPPAPDDVAPEVEEDTSPPDADEDTANPEDVVTPPPFCDPTAAPFCEGLRRMRCATDGTRYVPEPCPAGTGCLNGACLRPSPNVVILVDSSDSMDFVDSLGRHAGACFSDACPDWDFPACDSATAPLTRMGRTKAFLAALAASPAASQTHLALARFPQTPGTWGTCDSGYWSWSREITGDNDARVTEDGGWFDQHLEEVIAAPLQLGPASMTRWIDFRETLAPTGQRCINDWDCPSYICENDRCLSTAEPELRALGATPLGKSLFYVGEYLRRHVLVEGRPCTTDASCGTPSHTCVAGTCRDPFAICRPTAVVVISDGSETEHIAPSDFFHPRVQAKRLRYGLGCSVTADCGPGATCTDGLCRPPATDVDWSARACEVSDLACASDADCADFACGRAAPCEGVCGTAALSLTSPGSDRLRDWRGNPTSVTVHVVSASPTPDESRLIAAYGGGTYLKTDLANAASLLDGLLPILNLKAPNPCDAGAASPTPDPTP